MAIKRISFQFFLIFLTLIPISPARDVKRLEGKFVKTSWGDYQHLTGEIEGKERHFWCESSKPLSCNDLESMPEFYKGKFLIIEFKTLDKFVPEAGSKISQDTVCSIKLKTP